MRSHAFRREAIRLVMSKKLPPTKLECKHNTNRDGASYGRDVVGRSGDFAAGSERGALELSYCV